MSPDLLFLLSLAIKMAELFVQLGLSHSKVAYMPPETLQDEKLHSLMPAVESPA